MPAVRRLATIPSSSRTLRMTAVASSSAARGYAMRSNLSKDTFRKEPSKMLYMTAPDKGMGLHPTQDPFENLAPNIESAPPHPNTVDPALHDVSANFASNVNVPRTLSNWAADGRLLRALGLDPNMNIDDVLKAQEALSDKQREFREQQERDIAKVREATQKLLKEALATLPANEGESEEATHQAALDAFEAHWDGEGWRTDFDIFATHLITNVFRGAKEQQVKDALRTLQASALLNDGLAATPADSSQQASASSIEAALVRLLRVDTTHAKHLQGFLLQSLEQEATLVLGTEQHEAMWVAAKERPEVRCHPATAAYLTALMQAMQSSVVVGTQQLEALSWCSDAELMVHFNAVTSNLSTSRMHVLARALSDVRGVPELVVRAAKVLGTAKTKVPHKQYKEAVDSFSIGAGLTVRVLGKALSAKSECAIPLMRILGITNDSNKDDVEAVKDALSLMERYKPSSGSEASELSDDAKALWDLFKSKHIDQILGNVTILEAIVSANLVEGETVIQKSCMPCLTHLKDYNQGNTSSRAVISVWVERGLTRTVALEVLRKLCVADVNIRKQTETFVSNVHSTRLREFRTAHARLQDAVRREHPGWEHILALAPAVDKALDFALNKAHHKALASAPEADIYKILNENEEGRYVELHRVASGYVLETSDSAVVLSEMVEQSRVYDALCFGAMYDARLAMLDIARDIYFRLAVAPNRVQAALNALHRRRLGPVGTHYHEHNLTVEVGHATYHDMLMFRKYDWAGWFQRLVDVQNRNVSLRLRMKDLRAPSHYNDRPLLSLQGERRLRILAGERVTSGIFKLDSDRYEDYNDNWEYGAVKVCQALSEAKKTDISPEYNPTVEVKVRHASGRDRLLDSTTDYDRVEAQAKQNYERYKTLKKSGAVYVSPTQTWLSIAGQVKSTGTTGTTDSKGYTANVSKEAYLKMMAQRKSGGESSPAAANNGVADGDAAAAPTTKSEKKKKKDKKDKK
eukprot:PhM_4_TR2108/c0_g1_i1/m.6541